MTSLKASSKNICLFFSAFFMLLISVLIYFFSKDETFQTTLFLLLMGSIVFVLLNLFFVANNIGVVSPVGFFILSVTIFILARPFLYIFLDIDVVEIGNKISFPNILISIANVAGGLAFIVVGYLLFNPKRINFGELLYKQFKISRYVTLIIFWMVIILLLVFLRISFSNFQILKTISYSDAFDLGTFHDHLRLFFIAKQLLLIWVLFSMHRYSFLVASLLLFVGSIGFILIGLRGYTIAYLFLFLYFLNEYKKINIWLLGVISLVLIYVAAMVLEFRVGFKLFDNVLEIIPKTLYQQGASFEVVFGASIFTEELRSCIPIIDYFKGQDFGLCVDKTRGIDWEFGGFASSFFAEGIYLGLVPYTLVCVLLGACLKYLDYFSHLRFVELKTGRNSRFIGLVLFGTIPNLVYFGRASAFDLLVKVLAITAIFLIFNAFFSVSKKKIKFSN